MTDDVLRPRRWGVLAGLALTLALCGCLAERPAGTLRALSIHDQPTRLDVPFKQAVYRTQPEGETSFMLTGTSFESLRTGDVVSGQIMHISLLWQPKAGATPMDPTATNAAVRWVIIAKGEIGIYGGAGFATIAGEPGDERVTITLRDATLRQLDATPGFNDLLTPATLTGSFTAKHNDTQTRRLRLAASQFVTNVFGETKYVKADDRRDVSDPPSDQSM